MVLLENSRLNVGEKENNEILSKKISKLFDIYVNDAFGTAHRAEATTYGVAKYAKIACAGLLLEKEINALNKVLFYPKHPLVAIVGGSKVSTKLNILRSLIKKVDQLIVGGGICNTLLLSAGMLIGNSLVESNLLEEAKEIIEMMKKKGSDVPFPTDVVVSKKISSDSSARTIEISDIQKDDLILDIGPKFSSQLVKIIMQAGTILWNGPMGVFEIEKFSYGTKTIANSIARSRAFSIAGGGDTLAAIKKYNIQKEIDYISTGGGAFLQFLEGKNLPTIDILHQRASLL